MASERKPITMDALRALLAVAPPPCPHHYALAPDVVAWVRSIAVPQPGETLSRLLAVEVREDATLPPGTWEPRNRDGSRWIDPTPNPAAEPAGEATHGE